MPRVRIWHETDLSTGSENDRLSGKTGSDRRTIRTTRLTQDIGFNDTPTLISLGVADLRPPVRCDERVNLNPSAAILLKTCFQASKGGRASV